MYLHHAEDYCSCKHSSIGCSKRSRLRRHWLFRGNPIKAIFDVIARRRAYKRGPQADREPLAELRAAFKAAGITEI